MAKKNVPFFGGNRAPKSGLVNGSRFAAILEGHFDVINTKLRELEMQGADGDTYAEARIAELRELIEMMTGFYDDMEKLETVRLVKLMTLGSRISGLIDKAGAFPGLSKAK